MTNSEPDDASRSPLPIAYGNNRLVLMVRDPSWAYAYWDVDVTIIHRAVTTLGGGKAFVRLIDARTGQILAAHETWAERGTRGFSLPKPDRSYLVDLILTSQNRTVTLLRSKVVKAPPNGPRKAAAAVFVSHAQQRRALQSGLTLPTRRIGTQITQPVAGKRIKTWVRISAPITWPCSTRSGASERLAHRVGSERRLSRAGSEWRFLFIGSESRLTGRGSEGRLSPSEFAGGLVTIPIVIWVPRHPLHTARELNAENSQGTTTMNANGSVTYTGPDGTQITMGPAQGPAFATDNASASAQGAAVAGAGSALSAVQAAALGQLANIAGASTDLGAALATASNVAWGISGIFGVIAALYALFGIQAPENSIEIDNPDGSVTVAYSDGTTLTMGPAKFVNDDDEEDDDEEDDDEEDDDEEDDDEDAQDADFGSPTSTNTDSSNENNTSSNNDDTDTDSDDSTGDEGDGDGSGD